MLRLASKIVSAYARSNPLAAAEFPALMAKVAAALEQTVSPNAPAVDLSPAVPVKKSVTPDAIICLECGKRQKSMRRHLQAAHGQTPDQYRDRWDLGRDYPMVAPSYAEKRSQLARDSGLGRKPGAIVAKNPVPAAKPVKVAATAKPVKVMATAKPVKVMATAKPVPAVNKAEPKAEAAPKTSGKAGFQYPASRWSKPSK
jgi:predicted transcriptional regulator